MATDFPALTAGDVTRPELVAHTLNRHEAAIGKKADQDDVDGFIVEVRALRSTIIKTAIGITSTSLLTSAAVIVGPRVLGG
jgi:hypothetical protein